MTTTLEQTLAAICAEHDLTTFGVSCHPSSPESFQFTASCHWDGFSRRNIACASFHAADIATAVSGCLVAMREDRKPDVGGVPTLPAFEVAA